MDTQNNYIDNKIKELADYEPAVQPNWDAFYAKNQQTINNLRVAGEKMTLLRIVRTSMFRNSIIVISSVGLLIAVYFLLTPPTITNGGEKMTVPQNELNSIENEGTQLREPGPATLHENKSDQQLNDHSAKKEPAKADGYKIENKSSDANKTPASDSVQANPVVIRKTVVIHDTVRVTKPYKK